jgi:hypothetical protein
MLQLRMLRRSAFPELFAEYRENFLQHTFIHFLSLEQFKSKEKMVIDKKYFCF